MEDNIDYAAKNRDIVDRFLRWQKRDDKDREKQPASNCNIEEWLN